VYRRIVAAKVRRAWRHLDQHDYPYVLDQFAPRFEHHFVGDHAMGGTRRSRAAMEAWFQRVFRLFPAIRFSLDDVVVRGWPWKTRAVALVSVDSQVNGRRYRNEVAQTLDIRWGRIAAIHNLEDTQRLAEVLARLAADGVEEAASAPIEG